MTHYVIQAKDKLIFWTGKDWNCPAKKYKSRKIAERAIKQTVSNCEFDKYKKEVVEITPVLN
jgi:hypothetical protein